MRVAKCIRLYDIDLLSSLAFTGCADLKVRIAVARCSDCSCGDYSGPLQWRIAVAHFSCSGSLQWPIAVAHYSGPLQRFIAVAHCSGPLQWLISLLLV